MTVFVIVAESGRNRKHHRLGFARSCPASGGTSSRAVAAMSKNVRNGGPHSVLALHDLVHMLCKELLRNHSFSVRPEQLLHLKVFVRHRSSPAFRVMVGLSSDRSSDCPGYRTGRLSCRQ